MLLVHAHPDDETLWTGATMARYAAEGAHVTLVTCTLGEQGEVIPPGLANLAADQEDRLGPHRAEELAAAMAALGVTDHRLLAGGRWHDSGMAWVAPGLAGPAPTAGPDAFAHADLGEAAEALALVLRELRPQVVVTYDPEGGYGHPDHIKAHETTMAATELVTSDSYRPTTYWIREPRSWADDEVRRLTTGGQTPPSMTPPDPAAQHPSAVVDDDVVTTVVDGSAYLARKRAALLAHATQVRVEGDCFALSNGEAHLLTARDAFQRVDATDAPGPPTRRPWTDDLFG